MEQNEPIKCVIEIDPTCPNSLISANCRVRLGDKNLGLVQSFTVTAEVGQIPYATIRTLLKESELAVLQENTRLIVEIKDREAYQVGYDSISKKESPKKYYEPGSYGEFLFNKGKDDAWAEIVKISRTVDWDQIK